MKRLFQSRKCVALLLVLVMVLGLAGCSSKNTAPQESPQATVTQDTTITILSFSDFHGAVDNATSSKNPGMDKFAAVIKEYQANQSDTHGYIVVSGGDNYQGSAMSNLTEGKVISEMFKELGVVYSAIGNHEYDWGSDNFETWEQDGGFEFLAANVVYKDTGEPVDYAAPYGIVEMNGKKIGFIGIATPETAMKTLAENVEDLQFTDPVEAVNKYTKVLREEEKVDAVIVLSHLGATQSEDRAITGEAADLANAGVDVDAILSGHTHNFIIGTENDIPIIQMSNNGRALGTVDLKFTGDDLDVTVDVRNLTAEVDDLASDEATREIYERYQRELETILGEKVADLPMDLEHDRDTGVSDLGTYTSKVIAEVTNSQIGLNNGGGIRTSLEAGDLTVGDMYTVFPFDNNVVTMEITGADLKKNLEYGLDPDNGIGYIQYYGVNVVYDPSLEAGERIAELTLTDGTKVDMDAYYKVATNEFMASNGDGYDFSNARNVTDTGIVMRDCITEYLRQIGTVSFEHMNNYIEK